MASVVGGGVRTMKVQPHLSPLRVEADYSEDAATLGEMYLVMYGFGDFQKNS